MTFFSDSETPVCFPPLVANATANRKKPTTMTAITLATLKDASEQEVFNQVCDHLLTQGFKAREEPTQHSACTYRNDMGHRCAAGCLIGDDEYTERFEGRGWSDLVREKEAPAAHAGLISELQIIHDEYSVEEWSTAMHHLARSRGLTQSALLTSKLSN